jgi:nicotinamidase-related amidase
MSAHTALLVIDMQTALFEVPGNPTYRETALLANIIEHLLCSSTCNNSSPQHPSLPEKTNISLKIRHRSPIKKK